MSSHITIAHITAPAAFGGLERVVAGLARSLPSPRRRIVLIAVLEPGVALPRWAEALVRIGVVVEALQVPARSYGMERWHVAEILRRHDVDVVHTHGPRPDVVDGSVARRLGRPVVSTVHGFTRNGLKGRLSEWIQMRALRRFDAVVAVSRPMACELARDGVPVERLLVIPNGIVPDLVPSLDRVAARKTLGLSADARVVGWVGRFSAEKAPQLMLEALSGMTDGGVTLCMIGSGTELAGCRDRAHRLGLDKRVVFAGAVADAARLYRAFDVLALSSRTEGTPMVLLEAAEAGVPIVATAVGGVPDLLGADGGLLVPPGDAVALARALDTALDDPEAATRAAVLRERLSTATATDDWIARYAALYDRLAATARSTPRQRTSMEPAAPPRQPTR